MPTVVLEAEMLNSKPLIYEILLYEIKKLLPMRLRRKLRLRDVRREMMEKHGEKAFLEPDRLKFPVINPETGKYDCRLIYAARIRAKQYHREDLARKAEELYKNKNCADKINIHVEEVGTFDLDSFLELL